MDFSVSMLLFLSLDDDLVLGLGTLDFGSGRLGRGEPLRWHVQQVDPLCLEQDFLEVFLRQLLLCSLLLALLACWARARDQLVLAFESGHAHCMLLNLVLQLPDALGGHVGFHRLARGDLRVTILDDFALHLDLLSRTELLSARAVFLGDLLGHLDCFSGGNDGIRFLVDDFFSADRHARCIDFLRGRARSRQHLQHLDLRDLLDSCWVLGLSLPPGSSAIRTAIIGPSVRPSPERPAAGRPRRLAEVLVVVGAAIAVLVLIDRDSQAVADISLSFVLLLLLLGLESRRWLHQKVVDCAVI